MRINPAPVSGFRRQAPAQSDLISVQAGLGGEPDGTRLLLTNQLSRICYDALRGMPDWERQVAQAARRMGQQWAERQNTIEPLLTMAHQIMSGLLDQALTAEGTDPTSRRDYAGRMNALAAKITMELMNGFSAHEFDAPRRAELTQPELAGALLSGRHLSVSQAGVTVAPAYAVVAVNAPNVPFNVLERTFSQYGGVGTLCLLSDGKSHVLMPAGTLDEALPRCERVHAQLRGPAWLGVAHEPVPQLPSAQDLADDVLTVTSPGREPGVYQIDDVMIEYAAATTPAVASRLVSMIQPVISQPILRQTLNALILADGNRARAAHQLIIHRSTIDYRLQRIETLTKQCPTSIRGLSMLSTAMVVHALWSRGRVKNAA